MARILWVFFSLICVALLISLSTPLSLIESARIAFGYVFALFLPGFLWTFVLLDRQRITGLERFVFAVGLSVAMVPLLIFTANRLGVPTTPLSIVLEIFGLVVVACLFILRRRRDQKKLN
ncbi:MAG: DUF1616 domain-containing protein [Candidatus Kerfeldbacteria bacterium]|nr:DUF1616 domain-containing protein [Candidatus Kerfeldbacteria bacterium]